MRSSLLLTCFAISRTLGLCRPQLDHTMESNSKAIEGWSSAPCSVCACGCGTPLDPKRRRKNSKVIRGHKSHLYENLKKGYMSDKCRKKALETFRKNPLMQKGIGHVNGRPWRLRSPRNVVYEFINLREFVRQNHALFDPDDVVWVPVGKGDMACRASRGLAALRNVRGTWKGWTWHSITERLFNDGDDLLHREECQTRRKDGTHGG